MAKQSPLDDFEESGHATTRREDLCGIGRSENRELYEEAYEVRRWSYSAIIEFARTQGERITGSMIGRHCKQKICSCHAEERR